MRFSYSLQILLEERKILLSRFQRKSVNEEFNQYDYFLKMFLDTPDQYHCELEDCKQIEDGN